MGTRALARSKLRHPRPFIDRGIANARLHRWMLDLPPEVFRDARILDICTGGAELLESAGDYAHPYRAAELIGVDYNLSVIRRAQQLLVGQHNNITLLHHDIRNSLPFDNEHFDVIFGCAALNYLVDDLDMLIEEIRRVLKNGGHLVLVDLLSEDDELSSRSEATSSLSLRQAHKLRSFGVNTKEWWLERFSEEFRLIRASLLARDADAPEFYTHWAMHFEKV